MERKKLKFFLRLNNNLQLYLILCMLYFGFLDLTNTSFVNNGGYIQSVLYYGGFAFMSFSLIVMMVYHKIKYRKNILLPIILVLITIWIFELYFIRR